MSFKLPTLLRIHLRIFQVFGFFTLSLENHRQQSCRTEGPLILWSLLLFLLYSSLSLVALLSPDEFLFSGDLFGHFNDALKVCFSQMAVGVIYLESLLRRREMHRFWQLYDRLQHARVSKKFATEQESLLEQLRQHKGFLLVFYGLTLVEATMQVMFVALQDKSRHLVLFWSMFIPFVYAVHFRNMQFLLHIEILRHELEKLREDLSLLVDYTKFSVHVPAFRGFGEFLRRKLVQQQNVYEAIHEMFQNFQKAFGFSILAVLLMVYIRVLVDSYFTYYTHDRVGAEVQNLLLISPLCEIPAFLMFSKNCMDVVQHIVFELHSLKSQVENSKLSLQIQNFSLQILHEEIRIDGLGIARMDGYMLTKAFGSLTTYMLFFIQFMPTFRNI